MRRALLTVMLIVPALVAVSPTNAGPTTDPASRAAAEHEATVNWCLRLLRSESLEDRRKALNQLAQMVYYGQTPPPRGEEIFRAIAAAIRTETDVDARQFAFDALEDLRRPEALGLLIAGVKDENAAVASYAASGLGKLGPAAREGVSTLTAALGRQHVSDYAAHALTRILGAEANAILLRAWHEGVIPDSDSSDVISALSEYTDPAAAEIMTDALTGGHVDASRYAALYFDKLDQPVSVERMRWVLANLQMPLPEKDHCLTVNSTPESIRTIAVKYLGRKRDPADFETILRLIGEDPSPNLRTAAAEALGGYGDDRAVAALAARLDEQDEGFRASGHEDGVLHEASAGALGKIATPAALRELYDRCDAERFKSATHACRRFWSKCTDEQFASFLAMYERRPLNDAVAAAMMESLLFRFKDQYQLRTNEAATRRMAADFFADVKDADVVPTTRPAAGHADHIVKPSLQLYRGGFAIYYADFSYMNGRAGYGYTVVYINRGGRWRLLGKSSAWVS